MGGNIIIPSGALVKPHEREVAEILIRAGDDVKFLPTSSSPSPDILYMSVKWEIKSPTGSKRRTIENNLRKAMTQSENIIMDLRRINIVEKTCMREIEKQIQLSGKRIRRLIVISKRGKIINVK